MYLQGNIEARSLNHCCSGNTTMHAVCAVELHVTQLYKVLSVRQQCCYGKYLLPEKIKCRYFFM